MSVLLKKFTAVFLISTLFSCKNMPDSCTEGRNLYYEGVGFYFYIPESSNSDFRIVTNNGCQFLLNIPEIYSNKLNDAYHNSKYHSRYRPIYVEIIGDLSVSRLHNGNRDLVFYVKKIEIDQKKLTEKNIQFAKDLELSGESFY
jgi:hypothetical protein